MQARQLFSFGVICSITWSCGGSDTYHPRPIENRGRAEKISALSLEAPREVGTETFWQALENADVILLGERHDNAGDHAAQYAIIRELVRRQPDLDIGFEMFQTPFQSTLDAWINGTIDEVALVRDTEYRKRWGYRIAFYRPFLQFARKRAIKLWALNAPSEWTRAITQYGGSQAVPDAIKQAWPELDLEDSQHRKTVLPFLIQHAHAQNHADAYYQAQVLWDESMAKRIAEIVGSPQRRSALVALTGELHTIPGAIPNRIARRNAKANVVTVILRQHDEEVPPYATSGFLWRYAEE